MKDFKLPANQSSYNKVKPRTRFNLVPGLTSQGGQSLLEVLVALGIVLLVILALVRAAVVSIRNADFSKKQAQATSYAQEGMENIRAFRDSNWDGFWVVATGATYCLVGAIPSGNCPAPTCLTLGNVFTRCVKIETVDSTLGKERAKVTVTVSWTDSVGIHKSELISYFSKWQ